MKQSILALSATFVLLVSGLPISAAEPRVLISAPWERSCHEYSSDGDFVSRASMYCLKQQNQKDCHKRAAEVFTRCGFSSDYDRMSRRMYARMLVVWALAGAQKGAASGRS
jgi:hypothetical protein